MLERFDHEAAEAFAPNTAVGFLRDVILARPGEVTLLSIGPMTNSALLLSTYPEVAGALRALVIMGGSFARGGAPQEWNAFCDPYAARAVYSVPVAVHRSVGIDVTRRCALGTRASIERFQELGGPWSVVAAMTEVWGERAEQVVYHDPLAAVTVFHPEVCTWASGRVAVELASRRFRGGTSFDPDRDGSPHEVATGVDPDAFFAELFAPT
jgi:purine nucleosidase